MTLPSVDHSETSSSESSQHTPVAVVGSARGWSAVAAAATAQTVQQPQQEQVMADSAHDGSNTSQLAQQTPWPELRKPIWPFPKISQHMFPQQTGLIKLPFELHVIGTWLAAVMLQASAAMPGTGTTQLIPLTTNCDTTEQATHVKAMQATGKPAVTAERDGKSGYGNAKPFIQVTKPAHTAERSCASCCLT